MKWSARGDSNPDLHGLNVPRLPIAPRAEDGDPGRIRTATWTGSRPAASARVGLQGQLVPPGGLEPPLHGLRARSAALTLRREMERMIGLEPIPQGLEGLQAAVTPHSLWFGLRVSNPSLRGGAAECSSTPRPNRDRLFADPPTSFSCQRPRSFRETLVGSKGFEPKRSSWRRAVLQTASGPSARTARGGCRYGH